MKHHQSGYAFATVIAVLLALIPFAVVGSHYLTKPKESIVIGSSTKKQILVLSEREALALIANYPPGESDAKVVQSMRDIARHTLVSQTLLPGIKPKVPALPGSKYLVKIQLDGEWVAQPARYDTFAEAMEAAKGYAVPTLVRPAQEAERSPEVSVAAPEERDSHFGGNSYEASMLRNLLAVIHGDGGHYVMTHGLDKAIEEAERLVGARRAMLEEFDKYDAFKEHSIFLNTLLVRMAEWMAPVDPSWLLLVDREDMDIQKLCDAFFGYAILGLGDSGKSRQIEGCVEGVSVDGDVATFLNTVGALFMDGPIKSRLVEFAARINAVQKTSAIAYEVAERMAIDTAAKERPPYFTTAEDFKPHSWVVSAVSSAVLHGANYVLGNFPGERVTLGTNDFRDAYEGAREDLLAWRRRAQRAEATLRSIAEHTTEWLENHNPMAATLLSEKSLTAIIEVMDKNEIDFKQDKYRHIVTGDYYAVEAVGETQTSVPLGDKALVVVYRSDKDGRVWVRPEAEFRQRFAKAGHVTPAKTVKKDEGDEFVEVTPSA